MPVVAESAILTSDGLFFVQDTDYEAMVDAELAAFDDAREPGQGRGGGRLFGTAGGTLLVRCADQSSHPTVRVEIWGTAPEVFEAPWQWQEPRTLTWTTGHFWVSDGEGDAPEPFRNLDAGAGAGMYSVRLAHDGREAAREAIVRARRQTRHATTAESDAAWHRIIGIERYLIRVWPAATTV
ncbi:hypothetical protein [Polymorphospora sp. A560]|uniref:hypothetical protein n=1 Tax=Polymorphospora sp. A560 TaxID=3040203 RepID=UPI003891B5CE